MRDADQLAESALSVLERAYTSGAFKSVPLFSGGHDSLCAVHLASQHRSWGGGVVHIDTGIGAAYTRRYVERVCDSMGWKLTVLKSPETFEKQVMAHGFPGPGRHGFIYNRLKDRCVRMATKGKAWKMLVTGCRSQESVRRMGHVEPIKFGETQKDKTTGQIKRVNLKRIWTGPCHDWSKAEQMLYMDEHGLPVNRFKMAVGLSGECGCLCFSVPGERSLWEEHAPEVVEGKIIPLEKYCAANGLPCRWGERPAEDRGTVAVAETGPLCTSCDYRAAAAGFTFAEANQ